ncbi:4'-phosphopantetheinyl transferase superfamily protein [Paenibacillus sp. L3-i20]|uniref:4'-phosphopantetheinyl transferase family protein n=1 Tax=Paenibacillus sp. L3-i20 TaxID=2905833 RepID=UPI001EE07D9C|nr:4'-phosphopantetheinyl transferase superfamily protein [Paenibacillus sp. L3-i20]GKU77866.1 4'-phosphopantetheinyl transferase [Paenibacillus sp. L3-i20]
MSAEIVVLEVPAIIDTKDYNMLLSLVSNEKRSKINRFRLVKDAYRALLGDALIRTAIMSRLGVPNESITFNYNEYGKPTLARCEGLHFNLSHSGDWIVAFISTYEVGIDVEEVRSIDMNIASSYFAKEEYRDLLAKSEGERTAFFYELWTLKESYIKARGEGLSIPLHSFAIEFQSDRSITLKPDGDSVFFKQYDLAPHYKMAACSFANKFPSTISHWSIEELLVQLSFDWSLRKI